MSAIHSVLRIIFAFFSFQNKLLKVWNKRVTYFPAICCFLNDISEKQVTEKSVLLTAVEVPSICCRTVSFELV